MKSLKKSAVRRLPARSQSPLDETNLNITDSEKKIEKSFTAKTKKNRPGLDKPCHVPAIEPAAELFDKMKESKKASPNSSRRSKESGVGTSKTSTDDVAAVTKSTSATNTRSETPLENIQVEPEKLLMVCN